MGFVRGRGRELSAQKMHLSWCQNGLFCPKTILAQLNFPDAVIVNILLVVIQERGKISLLCSSILLIIPAAKPGPHSTKEHCTNHR